MSRDSRCGRETVQAPHGEHVGGIAAAYVDDVLRAQQGVEVRVTAIE